MAEISTPKTDASPKRNVVFETVTGVGAGAICGLIATALYDTVSVSIVARALKVPKIREVLGNSIIPSIISMGFFGYKGYHDAVKENRELLNR